MNIRESFRRAALPLILLALTAAPARALTTEALLDTLQHTAFNYFWNEANPANGMVKDRNTAGSVASIAAVGFGLSAIPIGIDHGWITRAQGRTRVQATLATFRDKPQGSAASGTIGFLGLFYHWLDMNTALRRVDWNSELSTIDTALLLAGIIDVREYFDTADPADSTVRAYADSIVRRCNWDIMRNFGTGLYMGWRPGTGFNGFGRWQGYNEAMIMYLLALGSPTFPIPTNNWAYWCGTYSWGTHYGQSFVTFPPLFGHQYSHCWIDFRNIADPYMQVKDIDYFENSRRATLAQQSYCIANPGGWTGYSATFWGITASDYPGGYIARGAPPAMNDDGTLAPTAAAASIPFAPEIVIPTLHNLYDNYPGLWSAYGFKDAINPSASWTATDVIGIDQGPILLMIENYRTGKVWERVMGNSVIQLGLQRAGFVPTVGVELPAVAGPAVELSAPTPNPARAGFTLRFHLPRPGQVRIAIVDVSGRKVADVLDASRPAGPHAVVADVRALPAGVYFARLEFEGRMAGRRIAVVR